MLHFWIPVLFALLAISRDAADAVSGRCEMPNNDQTVQEGATGTDVVLATVSKIKKSAIGLPNGDGDFLRHMAAVETGDGTLYQSGQGGLWRVSEEVFSKVKKYMELRHVPPIVGDAMNDPCLMWGEVVTGYVSMNIPLYSAMAVMIRLHMLGYDKIEDDAEAQGVIWRNHFNQTGDAQLFEKSVNRLLAIGRIYS